MQLMKFVTRDTKDKNKILVWCTTNRLITFRDFMQYALDNLKNPKDFMIIDTEKNLVYDMYKVATEIYGMKERTFEEIMNDVHTGKWAKYSDDELKGLEKEECKDDYTELFWGNYPPPRISKYVVEKRHDGKWAINKEEYCLKTTAVIGDGVLMWIGIEPFDSMVKAYAWLKKHVNELL